MYEASVAMTKKALALLLHHGRHFFSSLLLTSS